MASTKPERRSLTFFVLLLWALSLGIGLFAVLQVAGLKDEVRALADEVVTLSSKFSRLQADKANLLDALQQLSEVTRDGKIDLEERKNLASLAPQVGGALEQQRRLIDDLTKQASLDSASGLKVAPTISEAFTRVLSRAQHDLDSAEALIPIFSDQSSIISSKFASSLVIAINEMQQSLRSASADVAEVLALFATESIQRAQDYERAVLIELAVATIVGLLLGGFLIHQIGALQRRVIETEQLGVLGKLAVSLQHEINNPLSVIVGHAYLLRSANLSPVDRDKALQTVEESARAIASVIQRTKEMEKIITTEYVGGLEMVDLSPSARASGQGK